MTPAAARALACPRCGGALALVPGRRILRCPWCGTLDLVESGSSLPRYLVRPALAAPQAAEAAREALSHPALGNDLARRAWLEPPRLFWVPFYELLARRAGGARIDRQQLVAPPAAHDAGATLPGYEVRPRPRVPRVLPGEPDTRVVLTSWTFFWPAIALPGWGLEAVDPARLRGRADLAIERFDVVAADREGTAFEPAVDPAAFREAALRAAPTRAGDVRTIEERTRILYYPLWRIVFEAAGRRHAVVLDGVFGEVLRLGGPASAEAAQVTQLVIAAVAGLGPALAARILSGPGTSLSPAGLGAGLAGLALAVAAARPLARRLLGSGEVVLVRRAGRLEPA